MGSAGGGRGSCGTRRGAAEGEEVLEARVAPRDLGDQIRQEVRRGCGGGRGAAPPIVGRRGATPPTVGWRGEAPPATGRRHFCSLPNPNRPPAW
jgi:hypothetical protein